MRKHLASAVSARQVDLLWRPCEDRMETPSAGRSAACCGAGRVAALCVSGVHRDGWLGPRAPGMNVAARSVAAIN
jgi:hypothetical protein